MIRSLVAKIRENKQVALVALVGAAGLVALVLFRACTLEPPQAAFDPAPIVEETLTDEQRAQAAIAYAQQSLNMGYETSARQYESALNALSRDVDTTFPLTESRFADCLISQCQWGLENATVIQQDNGQFLVEGTLRITGVDGDTTQPYGAYIDVDAYGKITSYAPLAAEGGWD